MVVVATCPLHVVCFFVFNLAFTTLGSAVACEVSTVRKMWQALMAVRAVRRIWFVNFCNDHVLGVPLGLRRLHIGELAEVKSDRRRTRELHVSGRQREFLAATCKPAAT